MDTMKDLPTAPSSFSFGLRPG